MGRGNRSDRSGDRQRPVDSNGLDYIATNFSGHGDDSFRTAFGRWTFAHHMLLASSLLPPGRNTPMYNPVSRTATKPNLNNTTSAALEVRSGLLEVASSTA